MVNFMIGRYGPEKIATLFRTLQETLDIDLALKDVYGFDQYGLDTEWRLAIGIDPLPPPGQLERQLQGDDPPQDAEGGATEEVTPPTTASGEGISEEPTPEPSPTTEPSPVASIEDDVGSPSSPGACSSPVLGSGSAHLSLGSLMLLSAPLGLISLGLLRRRRNE